MESPMRSQATFFAQLIMIGTILSPLLIYLSNFLTDFLFRICAKLRDAAPEYDFQSSLFLQCLYEGEDRDPQSPQVGFLKGPLLIHVSLMLFPLCPFDECFFQGLSPHIHFPFICLHQEHSERE
jgi:hypothetical protein